MEIMFILIFVSLIAYIYMYDDTQNTLDELDYSINIMAQHIENITKQNKSMSQFLQDISIPPKIFETCASKEANNIEYSDNNSTTIRLEAFKSFKYDIMQILNTYDTNNWTVQDPIESSRFSLVCKRDTYRLFKDGLLHSEFEMPVFNISKIIGLVRPELIQKMVE